VVERMTRESSGPLKDPVRGPLFKRLVAAVIRE
jgi:hypothetical protein